LGSGIPDPLPPLAIDRFAPRCGLVRRYMRHSPYLRRGLERAGFLGGWLDTKG
jgi:hypothetical protein